MIYKTDGIYKAESFTIDEYNGERAICLTLDFPSKIIEIE
jgi:hypothetical protein